MLKIAGICCTFDRLHQLNNVVQCFLDQDYPADKRELIILDDVGQYSDGQVIAPNIKVISTRHRFRTLGEKRNASAALASPDVDAYCVIDDDDVYMPWHFAASARALERGDFVIPGKIWVERKAGFELKATGGLFHGSWAFKRSIFDAVGGYPFTQSGQDQGLFRKFKAANVSRADSYEGRPSYIYRWYTAPGQKWHLSGMGAGGYERLASTKVRHAVITPKYQKDWLNLHERFYAKANGTGDR